MTDRERLAWADRRIEMLLKLKAEGLREDRQAANAKKGHWPKSPAILEATIRAIGHVSASALGGLQVLEVGDEAEDG
ncbi:MAG: hypothetical protein AAGF12_36715 [Myxococcota bacterium]